MKPNVAAIKELIEDEFDGNQSALAREINVDRTQVSKLLKDGNGVGAQFFGGLMSYCKREGKDFEKYIFLPNNVNKINMNNKQQSA